jgi:hypothetical protein
VAILAKRVLPDGLEALGEVLGLGEIMRLIERTARWVSRETFELLPVWFPEHARRGQFYNANWSVPRMNTSRLTGASALKHEGNIHANEALTRALGLRKRDRPNWSCCHIWGVDDAFFQERNEVVQDPRFYSCVANMVLLPTPLKAFTDTMPEVKIMLRICARNLYGRGCEHESLAAAVAAVDAWTDWVVYPGTWPRNPGEAPPPGVMPINDAIRADATKRLERIRYDLAHAGQHYPRDAVRAALTHWGVIV